MNQNFYNEIRNILLAARSKVYQTANFAMVEAYWNIGKSIIEEQGGNDKAEYGAGLLKEFSKQMTHDFGKGFTVTNLKYMRQFYLTFPNGHALRDELSWELMNEGDNPPIGIVLCADKSESVVKYTLPENETQIFASKYKLYLPSEEELLQELRREYQALENEKLEKTESTKLE
nr:PDDEXK nuclease domain-containing protein [uncultured Acetatifactor sp.]